VYIALTSFRTSALPWLRLIRSSATARQKSLGPIMPTQSTTKPRLRGSLPQALGGCALLGLCIAVSIVVGAGGWAVRQRGQGLAAEPAIEYIVDASPRMALLSQGGDRSRISVARSVLAEVIRPANPQVTAGLRVFGAGSAAEPCQDTRLVVPLAVANQGQIAGELDRLEASAIAEAALASAILSAIRDLAQTQGPHTLVVITGGVDSCNPEAGPLIAAEAERAGVEIHLFVIGYQLAPTEAEAIRGVTQAGGGDYFDAADETALRALLEAIQASVDQAIANVREDVRAAATRLAAERGTPTTAPDVTTTAGAATNEPAEAAGTGEAPDLAQTACDHPYFPMREGATWTYVSAAGLQTARVTDVVGDQNSATATMMRDGAEPLTWYCNPTGLMTNTLPDGEQVFGLDPQINGWEWLSSSGAWLLPARQLAPGVQWTFGMSFQDNDQMGTGGMIGVVEFAQALTSVRFEEVRFGGEVAEALRVDSTFEVTAMGNAAPGGAVTYWYVRGVGLIRLEFARASQSAMFVLQGYELP
jgi:hypothetical protein